jgi:predicted permease
MALLVEDLRFAIRLLRKSPGFTAVALLTLALAIGANTTLFSVVNAVLLRPLPFPEPHRLFQVVRQYEEGRAWATASVPQYQFLSRQAEPFERLAASVARNGGFNLTGAGGPERVMGARVTQSFFEVLGVLPLLGRGFVPEEDVPGGPRAVVLSHGLWQRRFDGSPRVIGQAVTLNGEPYTVVGVAPPGLQYPAAAQLWTPAQLEPSSTEDSHVLLVLGRLKPGVEPQQVASLLAAQGDQLRASRPGALREWQQLGARELRALRTQEVKPALLVLLGAVGCVLLIACVNLANLQLARAASRHRELAVRTALGASPARIRRQLLTESVLLAGLGGVLGLLVAAWSLPLLLSLVPDKLPLPEQVGLDGVVLAVTFVVSVLTGLLFGVLPAWQASRPDPQGSVKLGSSWGSASHSGNRMRRLLVVSEVALVVILLTGAALFMKSFAALSGVSPGIDPENVLTLKLSLPEARYGTPEALQEFASRVVERVELVRDVQAVGFASSLPLEKGIDQDFRLEDGPREADGSLKAGDAQYRPVTPGYFDALKIGLVRGRLLTDRDRHDSAPVALINEAAERRFWPTRDPLGQHITIGHTIPQLADLRSREIVGVVRDVRELGLDDEPPAILYLPIGQMSSGLSALLVRLLPHNVLVRSSEDVDSLAAAVQREIQAVDPQQPVTDIVPMEEIVSRSLGPQRFNTLLLGLMAGLALVLAAVGIYGVLSYLVNQRTQEMGVRLALGGTRGRVVWWVLRQALGMVSMGVVLGLVGAFGLTQLLEHLLYSGSALDPLAFAVAPVGVMAVALLATWLPALRASRVDPAVALRAE